MILIMALYFLAAPVPAGAQTETPGAPVYIVQEGDTLWSIALRFGVSLDALTRANGITDPGQLAAGNPLIIPGLEGVEGILTTRRVAYGDNLTGLSRRFQMPVEMLVRLNHVSSPGELYAGANLTILQENSAAPATRRLMVEPGQSLLELAVSQNLNPWALRLENGLPGQWSALPGDVLHTPDLQAPAPEVEPPSALPGSIENIQIAPQPLIQGKVAVVRANATPGAQFSGSLNSRTLQFFPDGDGGLVSLQGVHAMTEPGFYNLVLTTTLASETSGVPVPFIYSQPVYIGSGDYPFDPVLVVNPVTVDPAVTRPEDAQWTALAATATPQRLWKGLFTSPAPEIYRECWPSLYGNRRSYNGSTYSFFHTGLDFCGSVGNRNLCPGCRDGGLFRSANRPRQCNDDRSRLGDLHRLHAPIGESG